MVGKGAVMSVVFSPDEKYLISSSFDQKIKVFDRETQQCLHTIENAHDGNRNCFFLQYLPLRSSDKKRASDTGFKIHCVQFMGLLYCSV